MSASLNETRVKDHIFVWTLGGDTIQTSYGTNCVGIIGSGAVVLIDPLIAPAHARLVDEALKQKTAAPVRFVLLTHHHTDHTLGAAYFASKGAVVLAHQACSDRMAAEHPDLIAERRRNPELAELFGDAQTLLPEVTFDQGLTLHVGGTDVEVWHPGWGHTPGDAFVFLPEAGVAITGDLLFAGYHFNYEDASIPGVRKGLQALGALDADSFIPGHGDVAGPDAIETQTKYHHEVEAIVSDGVSAGQDDAAIADGIRARFPDYKLGIVIPSAVRRMKEHIAGKR